MVDIVTVVGGSGFVGRHLVRALAARGMRVRVAVRRPDLAGHLQPMGAVGQIQAVQANVRYPESLIKAMDGASVVVNLAGILQPEGRQTFETVQAQGAGVVAEAARKAGIARFIHMSALGADANSKSRYARSKAEGEAAVRDIYPDAIIARPSVIFGPEDDFFNRFASLARMLPILPLPGGGATRMQPVYVDDVAECLARAVQGKLASGQTFELGGPEIKSLREIVQDICQIIGRSRPILSLPWPLAHLQGLKMEILNTVSLGMLPKNLLITRDQVELLKTDNVVSPAAITEHRDLPAAGIIPVGYQAIVPSYLWRFRKHGQFDVPGMA